MGYFLDKIENQSKSTQLNEAENLKLEVDNVYDLYVIKVKGQFNIDVKENKDIKDFTEKAEKLLQEFQKKLGKIKWR